MTHAATTETARRPWQTAVTEQLGELADTNDTHVVVWHPADTSRESELVARAADQESAEAIAGDVAQRFDGEIEVAAIEDVTEIAGSLEQLRAQNAAEPQRANEEATPPARELETDDEPTDPDSDDEPKPEDPDGEKLFDTSDYDREDLQIAKVDGISIDKIRVKFSGSVLLDRSDPADVSLYNRLVMGREVDLRVAGKVRGAGAGWTTNREGDLDAVVGEKTVHIDTVWVLEPENLAA